MAELSLKRPAKDLAVVTITGTAPLIVHQWSDKARQMMLDAQQGKKTPKLAKDPEQDFLDSMYRFAGTNRNDTQPLDSHGLPTTAFKAATVKGGGRAFGKSVKMTELRQGLLFLPDGPGDDGLQLTRLLLDEPPRSRRDMVRVGMGTADVRFRAEYPAWSAVLKVAFYPHLIDLASIVALIDAGGSNGVGEWRPEKNGAFGTFEVADGIVA